MIKLAFLNFIRSNSVRIGIFFILIAGIISLFIGRQFLKETQRGIVETAQFQKSHMLRYADYNKDDMGLLLYYIKFSIVNQVSGLSGLSIGQRDVNPSVKSVTIRSLEGQKYDSDLNNPYNLLIGNIDFNFVLVYLFPLLIIAFTYNLLSGEKENGTWKLVLVQGKSPLSFLLKLFGIRFLAILAPLLLIFMLAVPLLQLPLDASFGAFLTVSILYITVWFCICFWIVSLQKHSNFNAVALLSIWILLVLILPAAINNYLQHKYPVPEAFQTTLAQRKGYHEKWDMDKAVAMDKFYDQYPQFRKYTVPEGGFSWLWYYAMQQAGDDAAAELSGNLMEKLGQRNTIGNRISQFVPTLHLQAQLNGIARSGLENQLHFLDRTSRFHERLRLYFYPKIFEEAKVSSENWGDFKTETFVDRTPMDKGRIYLPLIIFSLIFFFWGWVNLKNKMYGL